MTLPDTAYTITGGCNCQAVRYRVSVPPVSARPFHPDCSNADPVRLPFVATDHCNDCRHATSSILPAWLCAPLDTVEAAWTTHKDPANLRTGTQSSGHVSEPTYQSAEELFKAASPSLVQPPTGSSHLTYYESSPGKRRYFCSLCGTNIAYMPVANYLDGFPPMLDIILGSVDREHLEMLEPERQLWWDYGVAWIKEMTVGGLENRSGSHVSRHPDWRVGADAKS